MKQILPKTRQPVSALKVLFVFATIVGVLFMASKYYLSLKVDPSEYLNKEVKASNITLCDDHKKKCIQSDQALHDMYGYTMGSVHNLSVIRGKGIASITHGFMIQKDGQPIAVFLSQFNPFDQGSIATCHACSARLGMAVYKFQKQWKLVTASPEVANMGSYGNSFAGKILNNTGKIHITNKSSAHSYVVLSNGYMGQGHYSEHIEIIRVTYSPKPQIHWMGRLPVAVSNCSGNGNTTPDWEAADIVIKDNNQGTFVSYIKNNKEVCNDDSPILSASKLHYIYDGVEKKFVQTP